MSVLLVVDDQRPECVIPRRSRLPTRLWTYMHAASLDQALAAGASPDASAALSLRATQLIRASTRQSLARSLRWVIDSAIRPSLMRTPGVPICRRKILDSRELLLELAGRLASEEPVDARGVARVRLLLTGVIGPLYDDPCADDLKPVLNAALETLHPTV